MPSQLKIHSLALERPLFKKKSYNLSFNDRFHKTCQFLVQRKYIFQIKCQRNSDKTVCELLSVNHHHEQE